ncbi:MAG: tyrosine--tRNA ligase [Actinomycetota bacterium]|nr:tyrosine--tRNA ligase [Actinomycetota bacterium]
MASDIERLVSGAENAIPEGALEEALASGRPLRVKLGIDPSRPDLHLGHAVVLRKLRQFQDAGHVAVLIIGDFTGRIGDPSGQSETRPLLGESEIEANARSYLDQAGRVLDVERAEVRRNSEWLGRLDMSDVLRLTSSYTVARMLERDDFAARQRDGRPISIVEFLYPLLQGLDSVEVRADVELGGTDQTFNLLVGREIQRAYGQPPQSVLTMPLLEGTDGQRKMSKSFDNYVALTEEPDEMFGKLMRVPDELVVRYLRLVTPTEPAEADRMQAGLSSGETKPVEAKRAMARAVVDTYHGRGAGEEAEARFDRVHRDRDLPSDVDEFPIPAEVVRDGTVWLPRLLVACSFASSNAEARRLVEQGAISLDEEVLTDPEAEFPPEQLRGRVLQRGRRRFVRLA